MEMRWNANGNNWRVRRKAKSSESSILKDCTRTDPPIISSCGDKDQKDPGSTLPDPAPDQSRLKTLPPLFQTQSSTTALIKHA